MNPADISIAKSATDCQCWFAVGAGETLHFFASLSTKYGRSVDTIELLLREGNQVVATSQIDESYANSGTSTANISIFYNAKTSEDTDFQLCISATESTIMIPADSLQYGY